MRRIPLSGGDAKLEAKGIVGIEAVADSTLIAVNADDPKGSSYSSDKSDTGTYKALNEGRVLSLPGDGILWKSVEIGPTGELGVWIDESLNR